MDGKRRRHFNALRMNPHSANNSTVARQELRGAALHELCEPAPVRKAENVLALLNAWQRGELALAAVALLRALCAEPKQPKKTTLVSPRLLQHRSMRSAVG